MDHPDDHAVVSFSLSGKVQDEPEQVISVVVTDEANEPVGVLEKWNSDAWIYAGTDCLLDIN